MHSNMNIVARNFQNELLHAHSLQKSSLAYIKHALSSGTTLSTASHPIVIGGTNWFSGIVDGTYKLRNISRGILPLFLKEKDFLECMEHLIPPDATSIGLNFAYPLEPVSQDGILDGTLIAGSKEHTFTGLVGKQVGKTIQEYIWNKRKQKITVAVANDTICLLLSGLTKHHWDHIAAGIVGTGMNFAIFEDEHTAVNLESGNFDAFEQSEEGKIIDAQSAEPGSALFEKEVSGAYLYKHFNIRTKKEGLDMHISDTAELDKIANGLDETSPSDHTRESARRIAQETLKHSAQHIASQIAGILEFHKRDITFVMQGSLFWKGYTYKQTVEEYVKKLTPYSASYIEIEHADLLGAAKLVI